MKNILLFIITLFVLFLLLDCYLQLAGIQTPMETRIDPILGPTYIPEKLIIRFNEGFFIGKTNKFGYMGPAIPPKRYGAERRILLIGDSYVLSHTVLPNHYFGRSLEQSLSRLTGENVHALNFGKADFNLQNMYAYYKDFAGTFDHDLTLFFVGKRNLLPQLGQVESSLYPTVGLVGDSLFIDRSFRNSKSYRFYKSTELLFNNSAILRLVFNAYKIYKNNEFVKSFISKIGRKEQENSQDDARYVKNNSIQLTPKNRAVLYELAKNPQNILIIIDSLPPELISGIRATNIPLIDLSPCFDALKANGKDPYYWPVTGMRGHWNYDAHAVIGPYLVNQLYAKGLIWPDKKIR
jgi:hypothetical protein